VNSRTTLIAAAALVLLGAYFYLVEYKGGERRVQEEARAKKLLPELTQGTMASFTITKNGETVSCTKTEGVWSIKAPLAVKGDQQAIEAWCRALESLERLDTIDEDPREVVSFGLTAPALIIEASARDQRDPFRIEFGGSSPTRSYQYARLKGDKAVLAVQAQASVNLSKGLFDLRDKSLLHMDLGAVKKVVIDHPRGRLVLEKEGEDWFIRQPADLRAKTVRVNQLVNDAIFAKVKAFIQEPLTTPRKFGLDRPQKTITYFEGEKQHWFSIGKKNKGTYYASRSEASDCVEIHEYLGNNIPVSAVELEDKHLFDPVSWNVELMKVEAQGETFEAAQAKGVWSAPAGYQNTDMGPFSGAIQGLEYIQRLKADSVPARITGLDQPRVKASFTLKDKKEASILMIGLPDQSGRGVYAKTSREPRTIYVIGTDILEKVPRQRDPSSVPSPVPAPAR
jgi:hypothetical protein